MHAYTSFDQRLPVYGAMAVIAVVIAWLIALATASLQWPQWLISAPSVMGVYAGLYQGFERWAWRWRLSRLLGFVRTPDLNGVYAGRLTSTFEQPDGTKVERDVELTINQSWSRLAVTMEVRSGSSSSSSISAIAAVQEHSASTRLTYVYRNQVNPGIADDDMTDHEGVAELLIKADGGLSGRYFNGRLRKGTITATRQP